MTSHELTRGIVMPAHCDVYGHMNVRHYAASFLLAQGCSDARSHGYPHSCVVNVRLNVSVATTGQDDR